MATCASRRQGSATSVVPSATSVAQPAGCAGFQPGSRAPATNSTRTAKKRCSRAAPSLPRSLAHLLTPCSLPARSHARAWRRERSALPARPGSNPRPLDQKPPTQRCKPAGIAQLTISTIHSMNPARAAPTDNSSSSLGHHPQAAPPSPTSSRATFAHRSRMPSRQSSLGARLLTTSLARPGPQSATRAPNDPPINPLAVPQSPPARCTALAHPILSPS